MSDDKLVKIKDINKMCKGIGKDIAKNMDIPLKEFKNYIKPREIKSIIKQYAINNDNEFYISAAIVSQIFSTVSSWVTGIQVSKLAGENKIDVYWDDELNCATFSARRQDGKETL